MLTWLADQLRAWGLDVVEVDGWKTRGVDGRFSPVGVMAHHTAAGGSAATPSLNVVRDGRPGLSGPLCQVLVGRDRKVYVIAAGKANHAGRGRWGFIPENYGNTYTIGVEIEHNGTTEEWDDELVAVCDRVFAALLARLRYGADRLVAHKEYAPGRKIDPVRWNMGTRRARVAALLKAGPGAVKPKPAAKVASKSSAKPRPTPRAPKFPLPRGAYFGPKSGPKTSVSGYYSHRADLKRWQAQMKRRGWTIDVDGLFGPETEDVARAFQKEKGLGVDGKIGPETWAAAWTAPVT